jgi:hypothetical protein
MIVNPAGAIIANMSDYDQDDCRRQEPGFVSDEKLFCDEKGRSDVKKEQGLNAVVMLFVSVPKRVGADSE